MSVDVPDLLHSAVDTPALVAPYSPEHYEEALLEVEAEVSSLREEARQLHRELDAAGAAPSQSLLGRLREVRAWVARLTEDLAGARAEAVAIRARLAEVSTVVERRRERLPPERRAVTRKFRVGGQKGYVTAGLSEDGRPLEIFLKMAKPPETVGRSALIAAGEAMRAAFIAALGGGAIDDDALLKWESTVRAASEATSASWSMIAGFADALAIVTSLALQAGVPLEKVVEKMRRTRFEPAGRTDDPDAPTATSIVDYVSGWLARRFGPPAASAAEAAEG